MHHAGQYPVWPATYCVTSRAVTDGRMARISATGARPAKAGQKWRRFHDRRKPARQKRLPEKGAHRNTIGVLSFRLFQTGVGMAVARWDFPEATGLPDNI